MIKDVISKEKNDEGDGCVYNVWEIVGAFELSSNM